MKWEAQDAGAAGFKSEARAGDCAGVTNGIKVGDIVQLKSGGRTMSVSKIIEWQGVVHADCVWFEGTVEKTGTFPATSLKRAE
ncbi:MAG: DUF2158 domain-containing protein [Candidatus Acidiferrales bacterium]